MLKFQKRKEKRLDSTHSEIWIEWYSRELLIRTRPAKKASTIDTCKSKEDLSAVSGKE